MELNEVKAFFEANKENDEVRALAGELASGQRDTIIKSYMETEDFKKAVQSRSDSIVANKIRDLQDKWEKEDLPKRLDDEIRKKYPPKTETEKRLEELEAKLKASERDTTLARMKEIALGKIAEADQDIDAVVASRFVLGDNEDVVKANVEDFLKVVKGYGIKQVEKILKERGYVPKESDSRKSDGIITDRSVVEKMQKENPDALAAAIREGRVQLKGVDLSARKK